MKHIDERSSSDVEDTIDGDSNEVEFYVRQKHFFLI